MGDEAPISSAPHVARCPFGFPAASLGRQECQARGQVHYHRLMFTTLPADEKDWPEVD